VLSKDPLPKSQYNESIEYPLESVDKLVNLKELPTKHWSTLLIEKLATPTCEKTLNPTNRAQSSSK
jgi:hypothetical protein